MLVYTRIYSGIFISLLCLFFSLTIPSATYAQGKAVVMDPALLPQEQASRAKVIRIDEEGTKIIFEQKHPYQKVTLQILSGPEKGKVFTMIHGEQTTLRENQKVQVNQTVVLQKTTTGKQSIYQIIDKYRLDRTLPLVLILLIVIVTVSRWKGLAALAGLAISFIIILTFIIPTILSGEDPLVTSIIGSFFIMMTTMYIAHGFSKKTHIAVLATTITLILTGMLAYASVKLLFLTGLGNDDAITLLYGASGSLNFQGLLLGGIIIGSLGVLNDITIGLAASIRELAESNNKSTFKELFKRGLRIGNEHIAALVNTLALAYAGAALPIFIFIVMNPANQPLWLILNSEILQEEIVRTVTGSIGLILAVPLTALLGALAFQHKKPEKNTYSHKAERSV